MSSQPQNSSVSLQHIPDPGWEARVQQTLAARKPKRHRLTDEQLLEGLAALRACWLPTRGA